MNTASTPVDTSKPVAVEEERWYSPVVIQLARSANIPKEELDSIQGTGYEGRLSKKDIKDYIEKKKRGIWLNSKAAIPTDDAPTASMPSSTGGAGSMTTSPVAASVQTHVATPSAPSKQASAATNTPGVEVKEMDRVRRIIADHMVMSKKVSPHVTNVVEVDVTRLVRWREKNKDAFFRREGVKLTYMPVITEAVAKALAAYPQVNVSVDGYNILFKKHINIGIAVSLNDGNLIVPVVHDADHLNLNGLAVAIDSLALKARDNKLMPDDIDGGTFTITNFGTFKSLFGTPIINQPQVAILGVGYIEKKPAVIETPEGDTIAIRHKMYLSLSYDHRVVDGMLGGNFLHFIADYLENWKADNRLFHSLRTSLTMKKKYDIKTTDVETLKKWYHLMTLGRALDEKAPSYLLQSLGWSYHAPYAGHDGIQLAIGQVFTLGEDFLFPYYRDMLTVLSAGMTAEEIILNGISKATDPGQRRTSHVEPLR